MISNNTDQQKMEDKPAEIIANFSLDIIHDISFDWCGKRIAVSSSDKNIYIYMRTPEGKWAKEDTIHVSGGPLWRVKWARPEFGQILATCSLDRSVKIYQKTMGPWTEQAKFADSLAGIEDIKFSPRQDMGLLLATVAADGYIRFYQAKNLTNVKDWQKIMTQSINEMGLNCFTWNKSSLESMMLAIGTKDSKTTYKRSVWTALKDINPQKSSQTPTLYFMMHNADKEEWQKIEYPTPQMSSINDISWSLMNGRSYHMLAYSTNLAVKIIYFKVNEIRRAIEKTRETVVLTECGIRISWNIMSSHLAISQPNKIKIYKCEKGTWNQVREIEDSEEP